MYPIDKTKTKVTLKRKEVQRAKRTSSNLPFCRNNRFYLEMIYQETHKHITYTRKTIQMIKEATFKKKNMRIWIKKESFTIFLFQCFLNFYFHVKEH